MRIFETNDRTKGQQIDDDPHFTLVRSACVFVLQFHIKIAHVLGRMNTSAYFLSHLDINPKEKILLQIRYNLHKTPLQSSDIQEEDQFYALPEENSETERRFGSAKHQPETNCIPYSNQQTDPDNETQDTNSYTEKLLRGNNIQDPDREQGHQIHDDTNSPRSLRPHEHPKLKILEEPYDTQQLNKDPRATKYQTQEDRVIIKVGLFC